MITSWNGIDFVGKDPSLRNLMNIKPKQVWGAQMYWISRRYAKDALFLYDRPFKQLDQEGKFRSSEVITQESNGYFVYPPLVIEDGIDSDRAPEDLPYHHNHFKYWGYDNYSKGENTHVCPFAGK